MAYLTTGKRSRLTAEYQAQVNQWARAAHVPPPTVKVRKRNGGTYFRKRKLIVVPPNCAVSLLVHEFAHHLAQAKGHGPAFRIALVQAATIHCGDPRLYSWATEYSLVQAWARKHKLLDA